MVPDPENIVTPDPRPTLSDGLHHMALCFSGGGFRAGAFALGSFCYLEHIHLESKPLSRIVKFISSASGGSFASMAIVHAQRNGQNFQEAYRNLFNCLEGDVLLREVLRILKDDGIWKDERPGKDRNLINGFAIAYDRLLFAGDTFGMLWKSPPEGSVRELCVCTTDFTHGQQFRFQHDGSADYTGVLGSQFLRMSTQAFTDATDSGSAQDPLTVIKKLKLGDILAASSCFPAGFEPIIYPDDFSWKIGGQDLLISDLSNVIDAHNEFVIPNPRSKPEGSHARYGFMDGGIVDNQGIDAFQKAEERLQTRQRKMQKAVLNAQQEEALENAPASERAAIKAHFKQRKDLVEGYGFDLLAVCDVSSNYTDEYIYAQPNKSSWFLKPSLLHYALLDIILFSVGIYGIFTETHSRAAYLVVGASGLPILVAVYNLLSFFIKSARQRITKEHVPSSSLAKMFGRHAWYFIRLPLYRLFEMIEARTTSVITMAVTLFLKKIRQDSYQGFLSGGIRKDAVRDIVKVAEHKKLLAFENETGFNELVSSLKSRKTNSIFPTSYLLSTRNRAALKEFLEAENWRKMDVRVNCEGKPELLINVVQPSANITKVANITADMSTTLWFDSLHQQVEMRASLIACGQFSICHALLCFSHRFADQTLAWKQFQDELLDHWLKFQDDPYWLYNQIGNEIAKGEKPLRNFTPVTLKERRAE